MEDLASAKLGLKRENYTPAFVSRIVCDDINGRCERCSVFYAAREVLGNGMLKG